MWLLILPAAFGIYLTFAVVGGDAGGQVHFAMLLTIFSALALGYGVGQFVEFAWIGYLYLVLRVKHAIFRLPLP